MREREVAALVEERTVLVRSPAFRRWGAPIWLVDEASTLASKRAASIVWAVGKIIGQA